MPSCISSINTFAIAFAFAFAFAFAKPLPLPNRALSFIPISSRRSSYTNWPHQYLSPIKLAVAGFYHLVFDDDYKDFTQYAFCGIQEYSWNDIDYSTKELMAEHDDDCSWLKLKADFHNYLIPAPIPKPKPKPKPKPTPTTPDIP